MNASFESSKSAAFATLLLGFPDMPKGTRDLKHHIYLSILQA